MNILLQNSLSYFRQSKQGLKEIKRLNLSILRKVFSLMGKLEKISASVMGIVVIFSVIYLGITLYKNVTVTAPGYGGTFIEGIVGQPRLINPVLATSLSDTTMTRLVYGALYTYNSSGQIIPELAQELPSISEDQKEYTVKLKSNLKFHTGIELTADDVIFTIDAIRNPDFKSPFRSEWLNTRVEKISDIEIKFINTSVSAPFIHNLTLPIMPAKYWSKVEPNNFQLSELNLKAVGSGAYKIKEINKLPSGAIQKITLESFDQYTLGKPFINIVIISFFDTLEDCAKAYQSKEISAFSYLPYNQNLDLAMIPETSNKQLIPLPLYQAAFYNTNSPILKDKAVRKILDLAINKPQIIEEVFKNEARKLNSPITPEQLGFKTIMERGFNPQQARSLLEETGWQENPNGVRSKKNQTFELRLITNDSEPNKKTAELLAKNWQSLKIKVSVESISNKDLTEKILKNRDFDVLVFGQKLGADPDPFAFWHSSQAKDPGLNISGLNNPEIDGLITEARSTTTKEIRQDRYEKFLEIIDEETPASFLNQGIMVYYINPEITYKEIGTLTDPAFRFTDLKDWYIKEKRVLK